MKSEEETAKLVLDIYEYAMDHKLDVQNKDHVIQIVKELGHEDISNEYVESLMQALQITAHKIETDVSRRKKMN